MKYQGKNVSDKYGKKNDQTKKSAQDVFKTASKRVA